MTMNDYLILLVATPLIAAILTMFFQRRSMLIVIAAALVIFYATIQLYSQVSLAGLLEYRIGGWSSGLGISLRADQTSLLFLIMTAIIVSATSVYAHFYFGDLSQRPYFWSLWLLLWSALNALFMSGDLFNLYVTLELMGLAGVSLASLSFTRSAIEAALRYLLVGLFGSMLFLAGVALIYAGYGSLDIAYLKDQIIANPVTLVALSLMTVGLLMKTALFPLHFWLPPTHGGAPAPVSAVLSALVVKATFYLVMRLWLDLYASIIPLIAGYGIGILAAAAVLWGSWQALQAKRLKLLAAYSTVAQLGYLFLFFPIILALPEGTARNTAYGGLIILALTHGFAKAGLFMAIGIIQQRTGHDRISDLGGTAQRLPITTFTIALCGVALIGLPPSGAFLGKWVLLSQAFSSEQWWWVIVIFSGTVMAALYTFNVMGHAFGQDKTSHNHTAIMADERPPLILAMIATVGLGFAGMTVWHYLGGDS